MISRPGDPYGRKRIHKSSMGSLDLAQFILLINETVQLAEGGTVASHTGCLIILLIV